MKKLSFIVHFRPKFHLMKIIINRFTKSDHYCCFDLVLNVLCVWFFLIILNNNVCFICSGIYLFFFYFVSVCVNVVCLFPQQLEGDCDHFLKLGEEKKTIFWWLKSKMLLRTRVYSRSSWWPQVCQGRRSGLFNFFTVVPRAASCWTADIP